MSRKKTGCRNCMTAQIINKDGVATFDTPEAIEEVKYTYTYAEVVDT